MFIQSCNRIYKSKYFETIPYTSENLMRENFHSKTELTMNCKIILTIMASLVIATMAMMMEDEPEMKAEIDQIKSKLCSSDSRPTAEQWKAIMQCNNETCEHFEKVRKEYKLLII